MKTIIQIYCSKYFNLQKLNKGNRICLRKFRRIIAHISWKLKDKHQTDQQIRDIIDVHGNSLHAAAQKQYTNYLATYRGCLLYTSPVGKPKHRSIDAVVKDTDTLLKIKQWTSIAKDKQKWSRNCDAIEEEEVEVYGTILICVQYLGNSLSFFILPCMQN